MFVSFKKAISFRPILSSWIYFRISMRFWDKLRMTWRTKWGGSEVDWRMNGWMVYNPLSLREKVPEGRVRGRTEKWWVKGEESWRGEKTLCHPEAHEQMMKGVSRTRLLRVRKAEDLLKMPWDSSVTSFPQNDVKLRDKILRFLIMTWENRTSSWATLPNKTIEYRFVRGRRIPIKFLKILRATPSEWRGSQEDSSVVTLPQNDRNFFSD